MPVANRIAGHALLTAEARIDSSLSPGAEDAQRAGEPGVRRPSDDRLEVGCEFLTGEVAVGVDHEADL